MKFFIDSADVKEIEKLINYGVVDGVTTNPSLVAKNGGDIYQVIKDICGIVSGPVSAEVIATEYKGMLSEAAKLQKIAENVVIKLPTTLDGLRACKDLSSEGVMVNMTLCFSVTQAILIAKARAKFVSPFVGRIDDIGAKGMALIEEIVTVYDNYPDWDTEILVASIRSPLHVHQAALLGADICTIPAKVILQMIHHPLTDRGLEIFLEDWQKTGKKI